jgi:glycosyltransferase involved in cell wall biosynthesis
VIFLERVDNMPAFVGAADLVIMPSESLFAKMDIPLVLLEAISQRVPLVLADVPPLSELLQYGVGFGVPPADEAALVEAIGKVFDNPDSAKTMGLAGEEAVNNIFNAEKMAIAVERIYDEVLEQ